MSGATEEYLAVQEAVAGEYSLQRELGRGGMGVVYLARDVQLDRDVALKVLPASLAGRADARARFLREARTAAGLSHPHIVPIHRVGEARTASGAPLVYFVMSYVEGETLGERLRRAGPLSAAEAARVLRETAWALAYAHGRGIVHRDVKPDNILLEASTGRALVTDFGIAQGITAADAPAGDAGRMMGTAHFMSPEQAAAAPIDGRSDLYALGVVGYLTVSGRLPFETTSIPAMLVRQATEAAPGVGRAAPGLPASLAATIDRCLARDPANRFEDGEAMASALAPSVEARPALPAALRVWLGSGNPLLPAYLGVSTFFTVGTIGNIIEIVGKGLYYRLPDVALMAAVAVMPLVPLVGQHVTQARRLFRAGFTLADLRSAIDTANRERLENEALVAGSGEARAPRLLRLATYAAGSWATVALALGLTGVVHESVSGPWVFIVPIAITGLLGVSCNVLDIPLIPESLRARVRGGLRQRLWRSRFGGWLARRAGAPERSRLAGASAFRATEVALGVAASELFAALPRAQRDQLAGLPATVEALEARAAAARAEVDAVAALAPEGSLNAETLAARRQAAAGALGEAVAALETIRLDLLRLHAGAGDLAPLTTLLDAARLMGEDIGRMAEARAEVDG